MFKCLTVIHTFTDVRVKGRKKEQIYIYQWCARINTVLYYKGYI